MLSVGDSLSIPYNNQYYQLDILEVQPPSRHHAILTVDADLNVDFAIPLDQIKEQASPKPNRLRYSKSANYAPPSKSDAMEEEGSISFRPFSGKGYVLGNSEQQNGHKESKDQPSEEEDNLSSTPFQGKGFTLKGSVFAETK